MKSAFTAFISVAVLGSHTLLAADTNSFPVKIQVHAAQKEEEMKPIWRFFGADEPNYATMPNGKKLIGELGALRPDDVFFRAHNLLTSGDGTPALKWGSTGAYTEDANGKPVYSWTIMDGIFDTYRANHVRPYVEIGFMPEAMSIHPEPYQHHFTPHARYNDIYTGWAYPPKDYDKWGELVYQWAKHSVERYGKAEVEHWYWEVWNEANIGYWKGTPAEFYHLHDVAVAAVRRALPTARVGGMDSAGGGQPLRNFLEHCAHGTNYATGTVGTPVDFVSFHAKGSTPIYTNGIVRMGIAGELRTMDQAFRIISSFPEFKDKPIVIGEADPEGCAACQGEQYAYRNNSVYACYTADCFTRARDLAKNRGVNLDGTLTWAFEFENEPLFAGFRSVATGGIDLPVLNVFRMFSKMPAQRLAVESDSAVSLDEIVRSGVREKPDVSALASSDANHVAVMVWHYHDDDVKGPAADIDLAVDGLPQQVHEARVQQFRIDDDHSDAYTVWKKMGSPAKPSAEQYAQLEKAGKLAEMDGPKTAAVEKGEVHLKVNLPRQGVALLVLDYSGQK
jgi:xylan 1,4-beta-xylosidase